MNVKYIWVLWNTSATILERILYLSSVATLHLLFLWNTYCSWSGNILETSKLAGPVHDITLHRTTVNVEAVVLRCSSK